MKQHDFRILLCLIVATFALDPLPVSANKGIVAGSELQSVSRGMREHWRTSQPPNSGPVTIDFVVNDDGFIYEPFISKSSGNDQYDAECLETFCGLSPLDHDALWGLDLSLQCMSLRFGKGIQPASNAPEIIDFLKAHISKDRSVVVHVIPEFILFRYPGLITREEFLDSKNLTRISAGEETIDCLGKTLVQPTYVQKIRFLNGWWSKSLQHQGPVTRKSILNHAKLAYSSLGLSQE